MKKKNWLRRNLTPLIQTATLILSVGVSVLVLRQNADLSEQLGDLEERMRQTETTDAWLLDEVIELGQDIQDVRTNMDELV